LGILRRIVPIYKNHEEVLPFHVGPAADNLLRF
jgi:hypothetical protein